MKPRTKRPPKLSSESRAPLAEADPPESPTEKANDENLLSLRHVLRHLVLAGRGLGLRLLVGRLCDGYIRPFANSFRGTSTSSFLVRGKLEASSAEGGQARSEATVPLERPGTAWDPPIPNTSTL